MFLQSHIFIYLCLCIFYFSLNPFTLFFLYLNRLFLHIHFLLFIILHLLFPTHILLLALSLLAIFIEVQYRI